MSKNILYYSTDKLYKIGRKKFSKKTLFTLSIISTILLLVIVIITFNSALTINAKNSNVKYNEIGNVDYKVYLKDNNYYDSSYLQSGMQYVASLIQTVNVKFNYEIHSTEEIDFNNTYKIKGEIQVTEQNEPSKVLLVKNVDLGDTKSITKKDNNLVINEDLDIDYGKYNEIVNSYKKDLGLIVSANLIVKLETNTEGIYGKEKMDKRNSLRISIPLSEATLNINMDSNKINNSGTLGNYNKLVRINDNVTFIIFILTTIIFVFNIVLDIYIYVKHYKNNVYKQKVSRILKDYDRLIATGTADIDERRYPNKFYPENFKEMVDIAQNLNVPIMYYEAIPNEKCFFIIIKDDTLYKYRLTRAYLENNPTNNKENDAQEDNKSKKKDKDLETI